MSEPSGYRLELIQKNHAIQVEDPSTVYNSLQIDEYFDGEKKLPLIGQVFRAFFPTPRPSEKQASNRQPPQCHKTRMLYSEPAGCQKEYITETNLVRILAKRAKPFFTSRELTGIFLTSKKILQAILPADQ